MIKRVLPVVLVTVFAACGGATHATKPAAPPKAVIDPGDRGRYSVTLHAGDFVDHIDNPYLPLKVGSRWVYERDDHSKVVVTVTGETKTILGIRATVVRDTLRDEKGAIAEDTFDWYGQDRAGNVWYLGEETKEFTNGKVSSTAGRWEAGVKGALPGIAMPAHPQIGKGYRQEFLAGEAEDLAVVRRSDGRAVVPLGSYDKVLVIREWTPLEAKVIEEKQYAPGVGNLSTRIVAGGHEVERLVEYRPGP
jgi:hypothetical protein